MAANKESYRESVNNLEKKQGELDAILGEINQKAIELDAMKDSKDKLTKELKDTDAKTKKLRETKAVLEKEIRTPPPA